MIENGLDSLPQAYREGFAELADRLRRLLGGNLIGFSAYGGWLAEDPFLEAACPAS